MRALMITVILAGCGTKLTIDTTADIARASLGDAGTTGGDAAQSVDLAGLVATGDLLMSMPDIVEAADMVCAGQLGSLCFTTAACDCTSRRLRHVSGDGTNNNYCVGIPGDACAGNRDCAKYYAGTSTGICAGGVCN